MLNSTFIRYFIIGISGVILDFSVFALLYKVFAIGEVFANIISSFLGFNNNFFLNLFFNFKTKGNFLFRYFSYFGVCIIGIIISTCFLYVSVSKFGFNAFLSKFVVMSLTFVLQYYLNKKITFRIIS